MESVTRNTAYKAWIADLINGKYSKGLEQFDSGYVEIKGKKISRVNLIGGIIDKTPGSNYIALSLDDGSGLIKLKTWNENTNIFLDVNIGDLVLVIGKVKEYNNYIHINPEIIRILDNPLWFKVRKLELTKMYGEPQRREIQNLDEEKNIVKENFMMKIIEEKVEKTNTREKILSLIESLDTGEGANFDDIIISSKLGEEARSIINDLVKEGEIFELNTGKLRITG